MSSFVARYKKEWEELEQLAQRGRGWFKSLSMPERERLDVLYRRTTIHLARARTSGGDPGLIEYLNSIVAAAHAIIYLPPRRSILQRTGEFLWVGFARAIARNWREHALSALLVFAGGLIGYWVATSDPILAHAIWPSADERQPGSTQEQLLSHLRYGRAQDAGTKFLFASFLFQHNLKVGILALATGFLAAIPTVLLMVFNGMLLGVFAAIHHQVGITDEMWAWILPHGVTEIGAIILCGGVGLMLGKAVIRPGARTRDEALLKAGREGVFICAGVAVMLVAAAVIESYIRQSNWSTNARLAFAAATAVFWAAYILHGFIRERGARTAKIMQDSALNGSTLPFAATAGSAVAIQRID